MLSKKKSEQIAPEESAPLETVEALALKHKTEPWLFASAKQKHDWPIGRELTEEKFLAALESTRRHTAS